MIDQEFKTKLRRVIKGTECHFARAMPFCLGEKYYYMIVKMEGGIAPPWSPRVTQAESVGDRMLVGANVE